MRPDVLSAICKAYGSLQEPNFAFIGQKYENQEYRDVISSLQKIVKVDDVTDLNNDHGLTLSLGREEWVLQLSFVSRFALLAKTGRHFKLAKIHHGKIGEGAEAQFVDILNNFGFSFLSRQEMEVSVSLRLFTADPESVKIYQALFRDADALPW